MKKTSALVAFTAVVFSACNFQLPEKLSIRTHADYAFSIGDFSRKLSDYVSAEDLNRQLNEQSSAESTKFSVYDYNPDGSSALQQFLVDFKLKEIPIDIGDYLKHMDFSAHLKNMSFEKKIKIPEMGTTVQEAIPLPDISAKIRETAQFSVPDFTVPTGASAAIPEVSHNISISTPTFTAMEFSSGNLVLAIKPKSTPPSSGFSTNLTIALKSSGGETISSAAGINLGNASETKVNLPIAGKTLYPQMKLAVSGSTTGGTPGQTVTYEVKSSFSNDTKLSKVTGLTMDASKLGTMPISETVNVAVPDHFVECTMGAGSHILMTAPLPADWSGVHTTPTVTISGALTAGDSDFDKTGESGGTSLVNRKLNLENKQFTAGAANVSGSVAISLTNATIVFRDGDKINLKTELVVSKLKSVTMDFNDLHEHLSIDETDTLSDDVKKYVSYIVLGESGIKVTYTNTLPPGNDIPVTVNSSFFGLNENATVLSRKVDEKLALTAHKPPATGKTVHPSTESSVDFKAKFSLPGSTSSNSDRATFKDIEANKEYTLAFEVQPIFEWTKIGIKPDTTPTTSKLNTNLNLHAMFEHVKASLGDAFAESDIDVLKIPVHVYCSHPEGLEALKDLKFKGPVDALIRNGGASSAQVGQKVVLSDGTKAFDFKTEHALVFRDKAVTNNIPKEIPSFSGDLASLFNQHLDGKMYVDYTLSLTGGSSSVIDITKEEFDKLSKTDTTSIKITARIILPFMFNLKNDIPVDLMKAASIQPEEDLFNRKKATNLDAVGKYMDAIKSVQLMYRPHGDFIEYIDDSRGKIPVLTFDTKMSGLAKGKYEIPINGGTADFATEDVRKILSHYPFTPEAKVVLPQGKMQLLRKSTPGANIAVEIKTDGTIPLFGD
ncbi:MAG: hypothetical protein ACTTKL_02440 [Treponema sp.]